MAKVPLAKHDDMTKQSHTLLDRFGARAWGQEEAPNICNVN
jgi:hypothetical protein